MEKKSKPYLRTHQAIIDAFLYLTREVPFEQLTVQDILAEAGISRYTFYTHFHDKYEIAEQLQEEMYQEFLHCMEQVIPEIEAQPLDYQGHNVTLDLAIAEFMKNNMQSMSAIYNIHTETVDIEKKMRAYFYETYRNSNDDRPTIDIEASVYGAIITEIMNLSFRRSKPVSTQDIFQSNIRVMAQSIGMHDSKRVEELIDQLKTEIYHDGSQR